MDRSRYQKKEKSEDSNKVCGENKKSIGGDRSRIKESLGRNEAASR